MNKKEMKKATNEQLVIRLMELDSLCVIKNGNRINSETSEMINIGNELMRRGVFNDFEKFEKYVRE